MNDLTDKITVGRVIGGLAAIGAAGAVMFWGVPYYINHQVRGAVANEFDAVGLPNIQQTTNGNKAVAGAILNRLEGMEKRMIERDKMFMDYLERQAELARERSQ